MRTGAVLVFAACLLVAPARAAESRPGLQPCRLGGVEHDAWCGKVVRPLDPARPHGATIDVHFAVLPAVARNRRADPVVFFAGGPGQSALELAGPVSRLLARFTNRRDIVLIDQRGTGRSAPLVCDDSPPGRALAESADPERQLAELRACRERLQRLPWGDLRQYTTPIAVQDADAVRAALGVERVDLVGASYGTRVALEYLRQFPQQVRRVVIDGVAPPDMSLPATSSPDAQAAFDAMVASCDADAGCRARHPALREHWRALLASLPREAVVQHPLTGAPERLTLTRDLVVGLVRQPLYAPITSSALPLAIDEAAAGRFSALVGLAAGFAGGRGAAPAQGMHYSVVCAEDLPMLATSADKPGPDFGTAFARLYERACADWPRGVVPEAFYRVPPSPVPVLLLSGGIDPATPPRHAERVAKALGPKARHLVVANAGHGTLALGCMRDVVYRFIDAESEDGALAVDARCVEAIPRPPDFRPPVAEGAR